MAELFYFWPELLESQNSSCKNLNRTTEAPSTTTEVGSTSVGTVEETTESLLEKLKLLEEENEKLEAKINGLKQEYEKIGLQVILKL